MFFKLLLYDFKNGLVSHWKNFLITAVVACCAYVDYAVRLSAYAATTIATTLPIHNTLGNALLCIFGGMREYDPTIDKQFIFPVTWMLLYLILAYFTLHYPHKDLETSGQKILICSGGRRLWWISKCIWNVFTVIAYFAVAWLVLLLANISLSVSLSLELSLNIGNLLDLPYTEFMLFPTELNLEFFLLAPLVMIACNFLQMILSLFIKPICSYLIICALLLASAYYQSPLLIGNYAMPLRSSRMIANGVDPIHGIFVSIGVILVAFLVGLIRFKRYDIFSGEE